MPLTPDQQKAVSNFKRGRNVRVTAVPGAGKTHVILHACQQVNNKKCLVLAYNRDLCEATRKAICAMNLTERVQCYTFHGLATCLVRPTYDDVALHELLQDLRASDAATPRLDADCIIIDEAQDLRQSFYELIPYLVNVRQNMQYMIVGDANQMLYDYDDEDPALLQFLECPNSWFASTRQWAHIHFKHTHRCAPCIARFVSSTFNVEFCSTIEVLGASVSVQTVNMWRDNLVASTVQCVLKEYLNSNTLDKCAILVPFKRNNVPLRLMINWLSRMNIPIHVQGVDGQDLRVRKGKLLVGTWHSSKGTEMETCIVFGMTERAMRRSRNAAFVACTRAQKRLIILNDVRDPCLATVRACRDLINDSEICADEATASKFEHCESEHEEDGVEPMEEEKEGERPKLFCLDDWQLSGSGVWFTRAFTVEREEEAAAASAEDEEEIVHDNGDHDASELYRLTCLIAEEKAVTGSCRRWMDIVHPHRMHRPEETEAILAGMQSRIVKYHASPRSLLDHRTEQSFRAAISKDVLDDKDWCFVACACRAWSNYHNQLNQMENFDWMIPDKLARGRQIIREALGDQHVEFDRRLLATVHGKNVSFHLRVDACSPESAYHFTWHKAFTRQDELRAALMAALHPGAVCECYSLRSGRRCVVRINTEERGELLEEFAKRMRM